MWALGEVDMCSLCGGRDNRCHDTILSVAETAIGDTVNRRDGIQLDKIVNHYQTRFEDLYG